MMMMDLKKRFQLIIVITILTAFSLIVDPGYRVLIADQKIYIPIIYQTLNPELFQNDLLFTTRYVQSSYSFSNALIVFLVGTLNFNIFYVLFFLSLVARFVYFVSIYMIAFYITKDEKFSVFSVFLFSITRFAVYGTQTFIYDIYTAPRLLAMCFSLLFLSCFFKEKCILSSIALGIGLLMHPVIILPFLIFFYLALLLKLIFDSDKRIFRDLLFVLISGLIPILFFLFLMYNIASSESALSGLRFFTIIDPSWENILRYRVYYLFITEWEYRSYLFLIASACFFVIGRLELKEIFENTKKKQYIYLLIFIPLSLLILSFIAVDIFSLHFFSILQLCRSLVIWKIFSTLLFSYYAYIHVKTNKNDVFYNLSLIGIIVSFFFEERFVFLFLPALLSLLAKRKRNSSELIKKGFIKDQFSVVLILGIYYTASSILILIFRTGLLIDLFSILTISIISTLGFALIPTSIILNIRFRNKSKLLVLLALSSCIALFIPKFSIFPKLYYTPDMLEACDWIKNNTDLQDVFITEPFSKFSCQIRCECHRNVFVSQKDGSQSMYDRNYAFEWKKRWDLVNKLAYNHSYISEIAKEYDIDYVVSEYLLNVSYPLAFNNSRYFIYEINSL